MRFIVQLAASLLLITSPLLASGETINIKLSTGDEIPIERHTGDSDTLLLWLPSNFGVAQGARQLAGELAFENLDVWVADLHAGFFVTRGRNSVNQFSGALLAELIDKSLERSGKRRVLLFASGSGAKPALKAARAWQLTHPGQTSLGGIILLYPSLYAGRPALGQDAEYLPVVHETNLPIFIFQPALSTSSNRVRELQEELQSGGSQAYLRMIEGVIDGYHVRPDDHLSDKDREARARLPAQVRQASRILAGIQVPNRAAAAYKREQPVDDYLPGLKPFRVNPTPPLVLDDLEGKTHRLDNYRGKVVLVSFWASWCPPCVEEMPSLNRLQEKLGRERFRILGVNIAENPGTIKQFMKNHLVDFTVLLDPERKAYTDWKVYVVPSNFVLDGNGKIRLGSVGAIEWDSKEVIQKLQRLISETTD